MFRYAVRWQDLKRVDISSYAHELLGVPFKHQGRNPAVGIDCAGLVSIALTRAGVPHSDVKGYGRNPDGVTLKKHLAAQTNMREIGFPEAGCIILFRIKHDPQHVAVWDGELLIHAYSTAGCVTTNPLDTWWLDRIVACYEVLA